MKELVEDVKGAFLGRLPEHSALLEQVELDVGAGDATGHVKVDADELALKLLRN